MTYICIIILAYFLTDTLNWHMLLGKKKYLLNSLYEKLKNKFFFVKKNVKSKESVSSKGKQIKVRYIPVSF